MTKKQIFNAAAIVSITVHPPRRTDDFKWYDGDKKRGWWDIMHADTPEGFYSFAFPGIAHTAEQLREKGYRVEFLSIYDGPANETINTRNVIAKPQVEIRFQNGDSTFKQFNTIQGAESYAESVANHYFKPWILF